MSIEYGREVLRSEISALEQVAERLGPSFEEALKLLEGEGKSIICCGIGKAGLIARKIAATFSSTGAVAFFLHPADALHGDLGRVRKGDTMLLLSNSGESDEISRLLPYLRHQGAKLVAITGNARSTLGVQADAVVEMGPLPEACPLGLAPTSSTTAMLALGDALAVALMRRRNFTMADYARFHPAGALGRKSFTVAQAMRGAGAAAIVSGDTPVREVIRRISEARSGAAAVADADGQLLGIFTDGDLRRAITKDEASAGKPVKSAMTASPRSIPAAAPAAEALDIMRKQRIGELPVVDEAGKVVGLVDLKSLLAEGFF